MTVLNEHVDGNGNLLLEAVSHGNGGCILNFIVVLLEFVTGYTVPVVQAMQAEHTVGQDVRQVLRQQLCMVEHAEEFVEIFPNHDEVER